MEPHHAVLLVKSGDPERGSNFVTHVVHTSRAGHL
jgi:hypothetical protein